MSILLTPPGLTSHKHIVRMAEMKVSNSNQDELITYSLGLCLAVSLFDPIIGIGGLAHFLLPDARIDPEKAKANPCLFVNTGLPYFFKAIKDQGVCLERLQIKVAGGADLLNVQKIFNVGERNYQALVAYLTREGLKITAESIGGQVSRTMRFNMLTGQAVVEIANQPGVTL